MPYIDFHLFAFETVTKEDLRTHPLAKDINFGKDNRTWNKKQLDALHLLLCNIAKYHRDDKGIFFYSRDKTKNLPFPFNPHNISYSSLIAVIDNLVKAKILIGFKAPPRTKNNNPKLTSSFNVTAKALKLALDFGFNNESVYEGPSNIVRLRDHTNKTNLIPYRDNKYTKHIDYIMRNYFWYLNDQEIILWTSKEKVDVSLLEKNKDMIVYGKGGERIRLYRNYKTWSEDTNVAKDFEKLFIELANPNFAFGGRSGGYWQNTGKNDRPTILINRNETGTADFPASHINLCYKQETNNWYQQETYQELKDDNREQEDAYITAPSVHRNLNKQMIQLMLNVKSKSSVSKLFNEWIDNEADIFTARARKKCNLTNLQIMNLLEDKHQSIKDYFYKGKLAGQIIQWVEANLIFQIAYEFFESHDIPVLTVHDELIAEKKHIPMIKEFMYSTGYHEVYEKYSLMNQIKNL
ncbi:hypothetical protein OAY85_00490 [Gammaproteobacteria bacterium]|nr:hypothetical protein [Gammaproteobacteria bacterium]